MSKTIRQDTKTARRRCVVDVHGPSLEESVELRRATRRFSVEDLVLSPALKGFSRLQGSWCLINNRVASRLESEALASNEASIGSVQTRYGSYREPQISRAIV